jgi:hypothetical protein
MTGACKQLLAILLLSQLLWAQENINIGLPKPPAATSDCPVTPQVLVDGTVKFTDCKGTSVTMSSPSNPSALATTPDSVDLQTQTKYEESLRARYDYENYSYAHAKRTFDWQDWSGRIIFWMVMALVGTGLVFSFIHFVAGLRRPVATSDKKPETLDDAIEFEATLQGIKLKSSVLGLAILTMSMVFFYMYLKFVYPITNISQ